MASAREPQNGVHANAHLNGERASDDDDDRDRDDCDGGSVVAIAEAGETRGCGAADSKTVFVSINSSTQHTAMRHNCKMPTHRNDGHVSVFGAVA